ncbi:MAG: sulfurtransferase TusA family protein [Coriobacteriales bacterium]|nr:sulfurtransferase TusA family protein [Actinomycetes bacterium]
MELDVRGLSCPIPLMRTKKALEADPDQLTVLADSGTAKTNVVNLLKDSGYVVEVAEEPGGYRISARRG